MTPSTHELTGWFPGTTQPLYEGVYQRLLGAKVVYARFWRGQWCVGFERLDLATNITFSSVNPQLPWRGLMRNPATMVK